MRGKERMRRPCGASLCPGTATVMPGAHAYLENLFPNPVSDSNGVHAHGSWTTSAWPAWDRSPGLLAGHQERTQPLPQRPQLLPGAHGPSPVSLGTGVGGVGLGLSPGVPEREACSQGLVQAQSLEMEARFLSRLEAPEVGDALRRQSGLLSICLPCFLQAKLGVRKTQQRGPSHRWQQELCLRAWSATPA